MGDTCSLLFKYDDGTCKADTITVCVVLLIVHTKLSWKRGINSSTTISENSRSQWPKDVLIWKSKMVIRDGVWKNQENMRKKHSVIENKVNYIP